jgi:hypothetical protein
MLIQIKWLGLAFLSFSGHQGFVLYINVKILLRFYIRLVRIKTHCFPLPSAVLYKTVSVHWMDPFTFLAIVFFSFLFETRTHLSQTRIFISVVLLRLVYHVLRQALEFCTEIHGPQCWTKNKKRKRMKEANGVRAIIRYCFVCNVRSSNEYVWMLSVLQIATRTRGGPKNSRNC